MFGCSAARGNKRTGDKALPRGNPSVFIFLNRTTEQLKETALPRGMAVFGRLFGPRQTAEQSGLHRTRKCHGFKPFREA
jgi:hypothetical protein